MMETSAIETQNRKNTKKQKKNFLPRDRKNVFDTIYHSSYSYYRAAAAVAAAVSKSYFY
jgi:hypothetical protein